MINLLLQTKYKKITCFRAVKPTDAGGLPIFKDFLHNYGRAGILCKQI